MVNYTVRESGSGGGSFDYGSLAGKTLTLQFVDFRRGDDGRIYTERWPEFGFTRDEQTGVITDDKGNVVDEDKGMTDMVWFQFRVIRVAGTGVSDPWFAFDTPLRHRVNTHGIYVRGDEVQLVLKGQLSALMRTAIQCGLSVIRADNDPSNEHFDASYLGQYVQDLEPPVTAPLIVEKVLQPVLYEAANPPAGSGKVPVFVQAKTQAGAQGANMVWDSFQRLEPDICSSLADEVAKRDAETVQAQALPVDPGPPFPGTDADLDAIRNHLAEAFTTPGKTQGHVIPEELCGNTQQDLIARLQWLKAKIQDLEPTFAGGNHLLQEAAPATLIELEKIVFPAPQEQEQEQPLSL